MRGLGIACAVALVVLACGTTSQAVGTDRVRIFDDPAKPETEWGFDPRAVQVARGTTVTFTNGGTVFHTVTSEDPGRPFDIGIDVRGRGTLTFEKAGTWSYHCGIHPAMKGVVQVCDGACL